MSRSDITKERMGVRRQSADSSPVVGMQMYALSPHTEMMSASRESHPIRSNQVRRRRSGGGLGSNCKTTLNLCHLWKEELKAAAIWGERSEAGCNTVRVLAKSR